VREEYKPSRLVNPELLSISLRDSAEYKPSRLVRRSLLRRVSKKICIDPAETQPPGIEQKPVHGTSSNLCAWIQQKLVRSETYPPAAYAL
jgi:hypothetical protein